MHGYSSAHVDHRAKTGVGAADPVLVRLTNDTQHVFVLAQDATYEKAGAITLHQARWIRCRRGFASWFMPRVIASGKEGELQLRIANGRTWLAIPKEPSLRVPVQRRTYTFINLSYVQYEALRSASPRRLLTATNHRRARRRLTPAAAAGALQRVGLAVRSALLPVR